MTVIFPKYIRDWISENKGSKSPVRFVIDIVVEHHQKQISYKENSNNAEGTGQQLHSI